MTPNPHTAPAVELDGLHKSFGSVTAVDGLSLTVRPGEIVAFLGPNGAGKTTTLDMLLGLTRPDRGTVRVFGAAPRESVAAGRISAVLQSGGLLRDVTVVETVRLVAALHASARPVDEVLERAGIADLADRVVGKCSGGQQQRLRFALALLPDPDLVVLDEPTTGMDTLGRRDFWAAMRADSARGRTVLFATHYLEEADAYADRIVLVRAGRIVADGTAAEVKNLAAGRRVTAVVSDVDRAALLRIPGVDDVRSHGDRIVVHSTRSDLVARYLLSVTDARDLEIVPRSLEEAFLTLTTDTPTTADLTTAGSPA
ncbi:ABC transporter ATP-binding protein [Rhodococcus kroppenstedtii]|nr:ABC transporter ATP-binding protein [Rhodococcus kroppenstedtii]MDV7198769.1 ABC transporter ATP-binding protein [Rhodococcus kroppenstedtii]